MHSRGTRLYRKSLHSSAPTSVCVLRGEGKRARDGVGSESSTFLNYQHFFFKMTDIGEVDGKWPLWKRQCTGRQQPRAIWERAARDVNTFCSVKWPITVKPFGLPCCGGRRHRALYCNPHISQARNTCCTPFKNNEYPVLNMSYFFPELK